LFTNNVFAQWGTPVLRERDLMIIGNEDMVDSLCPAQQSINKCWQKVMTIKSEPTYSKDRKLQMNAYNWSEECKVIEKNYKTCERVLKKIRAQDLKDCKKAGYCK
jgi:hypothetical protein